jgi:hypothetical protein
MEVFASNQTLCPRFSILRSLLVYGVRSVCCAMCDAVLKPKIVLVEE